MFNTLHPANMGFNQLWFVMILPLSWKILRSYISKFSIRIFLRRISRIFLFRRGRAFVMVGAMGSFEPTDFYKLLNLTHYCSQKKGFGIPNSSGAVSMGSMGSAEPINFLRGVLEPIKFSEWKVRNLGYFQGWLQFHGPSLKSVAEDSISLQFW